MTSTSPILTFGQHKGQRLDQIPTDYVRWLADPARATPAAPRPGQRVKTFRPLPSNIVEAARAMLPAIDAALAAEKLGKTLLGGATHDGPDPIYVIECDGDCYSKSGAYAIDYTVHASLKAALAYLCLEFPIEDQESEEAGGEASERRSCPDPEDDMIVIWEVLPSGHRRAVWAFLGWHFSQDKFDCGQGTLPGDAEPLFTLAVRDY